jgi:error-prone DNA polymerase
VRTAFGAELSLDPPGPQNGVPDPTGTRLLVLARGLPGYRRLARVLSSAHLRGQEAGRPGLRLDEVVNEPAGHALMLTGGRMDPVRLVLEQYGPEAAAGPRRRQLTDHGYREDSAAQRPAHPVPGAGGGHERSALLAAGAGQAGRRPRRGALARRSPPEMDGPWSVATVVP